MDKGEMAQKGVLVLYERRANWRVVGRAFDLGGFVCPYDSGGV